MEVFSVFATLSLVDLVSGPLDKVRLAMKGTEGGVASLGQRMGNLALAMGPVALAAGTMLGVFGLAASRAMAFENAMADVAKVVNFDTRAEFDVMSKTVMDMAGRIPMAADGIAAIIAAAAQSGMAKRDLAEFAEVSAKMGVAFDLTGDQAGKMMADWRAGMNLALPQVYALADAVNHLSNNMNATASALGEVIQRVGAAAMACGLSETQVAALGAAFLSAGASPEVAATALKKFTTTLTKGAAMSDTQAAAFRELGFSATQMAKDMQTDAQGTIFSVLQALADKPKELQMSLLTQMFGEEAISAIAPLLRNMGNLSQAFDLVGDSANYAGSMQAEFDARSKTTANALQLLFNKLNNLAISVGNAFLPAVGWAADKLGVLVDVIRSVTDTKLGQWVLKIAGALGAALVAMTALSASMWFFSSLGPMLAKTLLPLKTALLGLGAPVLAVIAAVAALYLAYKTNFGGMADTLNRWWKNITLVVRGVLVVFKTLSGGVGEIRGELATEIKAAGLVGLVTTVARVVYRIKEFFAGLWQALDFSAVTDAFAPVGRALSRILETIGNLFARVFGGEVTGAASSARTLGEVVGGILTRSLELVAGVIGIVAQGVENLVNVFSLIVAVFTGDIPAATEALRAVFDGIGELFAKLGDLFGVGDAIREAWAEVMAFFDGINLFESGAKILSTLVEGIKSTAMAPINAVSDVFSKVRDFLPFSDAKTGPLSDLTLSGSRILSTLGEGVAKGAPALSDAVTSGLGAVANGINDWWAGLDAPLQIGGLTPPAAPLSAPGKSPVASMPNLPDASGTMPEISIPSPPEPRLPDQPQSGSKPADSGKAGQSIHVTINTLNLPNVQNAQGFVDELTALLASIEGDAS